MLVVACGIEVEFDSLSDIIHAQDLREVQKFLGVTDDCMEQLFTETELPCTD